MPLKIILVENPFKLGINWIFRVLLSGLRIFIFSPYNILVWLIFMFDPPLFNKVTISQLQLLKMCMFFLPQNTPDVCLNIFFVFCASPFEDGQWGRYVEVLFHKHTVFVSCGTFTKHTFPMGYFVLFQDLYCMNSWEWRLLVWLENLLLLDQLQCKILEVRTRS